MTKVLTAALVVFVSVALVGCSDKNPLSDSAIASMVRANRIANCDPQTINIRAGRFGEGRAQRAEKWFDNSLLTDGRFHHVMQMTDTYGRHGELSYRDGEHKFRVLWIQVNRPSDIESTRLTITACINIPQSIDVIDASFKENSARVLFRERLGLSLLAERLNDVGLLKWYDPIGAPPDYEYVAVLDKSSTGPWYIKGVGVR